MDNLQTQIENLRTLQQSYDQLAAAQASLAENVQAIKDAHILGFSYDGLIFEEGYEPRSAFGIIAERQYLLEVHDTKDDFLPVMASADYPLLEVFEMTAANNYNINFLRGFSNIREIIIPYYGYNLSVTDNAMRGSFNSCANLKHLNIKYGVNVNDTGNEYRMFAGCPKLIDLEIGASWNASRNILRNWNPTIAYETESSSLVTNSEDEFGNPITNNLQQLLYNIRRHIAANLRTDVGNCTITFSASIKAAILADQATMDAFPSNWTIA